MRITRLLFCLCLIVRSEAQNNFHPYQLDNIEWQEVEATYESAGSSQWNDYYYNFYRLCGDTLYDNTLYKKVYRGYVYNQYEPLPPWLIPKSAPYYSFYCFFRQDSITKSNYYRMPTDTSDRLLVSYNLNIGDTIKQGEYRNHGFGQYWVVQKKDSLLYAGRKLNILYTDTSYMNWQSYCGMSVNGMFLVEGLGHCFGLFYGYVKPFESGNGVDSVSFNSSCDSLMIGVNSTRPMENLDVYPNPCSDHFVIKVDKSEKHQISIYDTYGREVLSELIADGSSVSVAHLPEGLYELKVSSGQHIFRRRLLIVR